MTIDDFFKTIGYACLYKGLGRKVDEVPEEEITVSLFRDTYPKELFAALRRSGRNLEERYPGVYYVTGRVLFDTQIVVMSRLRREGHSAFRVLSRRVDPEDIRRFLMETRLLKSPGDRNNFDAVFQVSIAANKTVYQDVRGNQDMCKAMEELMADVIEKREQSVAQSKTLEFLKMTMENFHVTMEQAMDSFKIPENEREYYRSML